jgi:hypothetical protein
MATKLIILTGFLIAFAAGLVTGMQNRTVAEGPKPPRAQTQPSTRRVNPPAYFIDQLKLTGDQREKWSQIWSDVARRGGREQEQRVRQLRQKRDADILALIPEKDHATYSKILTDFTDGVEALDHEWRDAYDQAVQKTKEILTTGQRHDYEVILNRNSWGDRGRGGRGPRGGGGPGNRANPQRGPSSVPDEQLRLGGSSAASRQASDH